MKKPATRRSLIACLAMTATMGIGVMSSVQAQTASYPERPVRVLHGFAAGGNADTVARILAVALQQRLGQPFVVEPKVGAGGTMASDAVAKSAPDGHVLLLATGGHAIAAAMNDKLPYDTEKSFAPISSVTAFSFLVVVQNSSPLHSLRDLLAQARAKPDALTYGSAGIGTGQHMAGAFLAHKAGIKATHVPYRGDATSINALLGSEVDFVLAAPTTAVQHIKVGKLRALAVSGGSRWSGLPDVPTAAEQGVRDYEVRSWTALMAPAGTPAPVIDRLNAAVRSALADPAVRQKLEDATGGDVRASSPKELAATLSADVQRWTQLVKDARIQRE